MSETAATTHSPTPAADLEIAVIGLAGRFPGASSVAEFWQNLCAGRENVIELSDEFLRTQGLDETRLHDAKWRKSGAPLTASDCFDAEFFGYGPREAEILDPQQRLFLECAWHALEDAGYDASQFPGSIGVFGGGGMNGYLLNLYRHRQLRETVTPYELFIANDKDFLAGRVAYKLGLRGPAVSVQTACSTSLVAVHMACQSLLSGECEMALAGGVALSRQIGYPLQTDSIYADDGHCRPFDARASGTVAGNGVGIVVLKRLNDALADGDRISAVIKGSAVNNDGGDKVSFTAPSGDAQTAVIVAALAAADVTADSIGYVEAHGTATRLGDPIEWAALTRAFAQAGSGRARSEPCAIGSVKSNIGHLDAAAGIAGLIKTILAIREGQLPPSLNFAKPNPQIDYSNGTFQVNTQLRDWQAPIRRAGVSSFGIGGTNAHVILEQAPAAAPYADDPNPQLLALSAPNDAALKRIALDLADHLERTSPPSLADCAWTLQTGRRAFEKRLALTADDHADAIEKLRRVNDNDFTTVATTPSIIWLFPGQGSQHPNMAAKLYRHCSAFQQTLDRCAELLDRRTGNSLIERLCRQADGDLCYETVHLQPLLFAFEYALASLWKSLGVQPQALLGHSLGEYVAACLAGVFDLETALMIVSERAQWMQSMPRGAMLAVNADEATVSAWLDADSAIAAVNTAQSCVVSGPLSSIERYTLRCRADAIACQRLEVSHAFHSPMMAPAAEQLRSLLENVSLRPPQTPFVSNLTGDWIRAEQAVDPSYWAQHMLSTVRFADSAATLATVDDAILMEIGYGRTLSGLLKNCISTDRKTAHIVPVLPLADTPLTDAIAQLWRAGVAIRWPALHNSQRRRQSLPGYPFERRRYWLDGGDDQQSPASSAAASAPLPQESWLYAPTWRRCPLTNVTPASKRQTWLVLAEQTGFAEALVRLLENTGYDVFFARSGKQFEQSDYRAFRLDLEDGEQIQLLLKTLQQRDLPADFVVDLRFLDDPANNTEFCFSKLHTLLSACSQQAHPCRLNIISRGAYDVIGDDQTAYQQTLVQGLCRIAGQEFPQLRCRQIDLDPSHQTDDAATLGKELHQHAPPLLTAWRRGHRWEADYQRLPLTSASTVPRPRLRNDGTYLIIGDLANGLGSVWAKYLARERRRRIVLADTFGPVAATLLASCRAYGAEIIDLQTAPESLTQVFERAGAKPVGVFCSLPMADPQTTAPLSMLLPQHWSSQQSQRLVLLESLIDAVREYSPEWCCIQSSMSAVLGGIGLGPYAAAHQALDARVCAQNAAGDTAWFVVNWDAVADASALSTPLNAPLQAFALAPEEIWSVTERVVNLAEPGQIIVSRSALSDRLQAASAGPKPASSPAGTLHDRPASIGAYVAPRNAIEQRLTELWRELLRVDRVGIRDSFFDLGGHSLLAIQAIGRMRELFPVQLELRELLDGSPTIAEIAELIRQQLPDSEQLDKMATLLAEVEAMSDEDISLALTPRSQV